MTDSKILGRYTVITLDTHVDLLGRIQSDVARNLELYAADRGMYILGEIEHEMENKFYQSEHQWTTVRMYTWARCAPIIELWESILDD